MDESRKSKRACVIGSGFGGLSAAVRLQAAGYATTLVEKLDQPGGRAYVFRDQGFTFDAGPTVITAPECIEELFTLAGRSMRDYVELLPVEPFYQLCWEDGSRFNYGGNLEDTLAQIEQHEPRDVEGYLRFLDYSREVYHEGYEKLGHVPFLNWGSMLRVAPQLVRLKAYRSVYSQVARFIRSKKLREAFSFHSLLVGGNPFRSSSIYTLIHYLERKGGVHFPRGGTGALVQGLVRLFEDLGGTLLLGAEVEQIVTENRHVTGVRLVDGRFIPADRVVSNAEVMHTYERLLSRESAVKPTRQRLERMSYSMSLFLIYFGTRKKYPEVAHHSVIFGPRYRELLDDIFKHGKLADDFSLYLHAPTRTDPSLAPEGHEAFYVLAPVPNLGVGDTDWSQEGPRYAERILDYLEKHHLPGLREHLVTQRIVTPDYFRDTLNSHLGAAFSLEPVLHQSAAFRTKNRDPHISGLYIVGAGTHPGAGLPGVIGSAKATVNLMLEDDRTVALEQGLAIQRGSKSFGLASKLLPQPLSEAAATLYSWCRYCDDQIDEGGVSFEAKTERLKSLEAQTRAAMIEASGNAHWIFSEFATVARRYRIPEAYALDLLRGMEMDLHQTRYETFEELRRYCYHVAGTVGLMMTHVMGVGDPGALKHAVDLGIAMQLTNIARDVREDLNNGRLYLPLSWLKEMGIPDGVGSSEQWTDPRYREAVFTAVKRLLERAEEFYRSGEQGLRYLPWRSSLAIGAASAVYREIGRQILRNGAESLNSRTIVSLRKKLFVIAGSILRAFTQGSPWSARRVPRPIAETWRYS